MNRQGLDMNLAIQVPKSSYLKKKKIWFYDNHSWEKWCPFLHIDFMWWILTLFLGIAVDRLSMIMHTLAMLGEYPEIEFSVIYFIKQKLFAGFVHLKWLLKNTE